MADDKNSPTRARLEIKTLGQGTHTSLHFWAVTGTGRSVRRQRLFTVYVDLPLTSDNLPAVLRRAASSLEQPPAERWTPHA